MSDQEISREDLDLIDRIFDIIDINADGTVDIKKLQQNLPSCCEGPRLKDVEAILDEMAANIDWTDFLDALKLGLIHQAHARSGDGVSIEEEAKEAETSQEWTARREQTKFAKVHRLDTETDPLSKDMRKGLLKMFNRMDPDGDGYVSLQEFQAFMMENRSAIGSKKIVELFDKIKDTTQMETEELENKGITFMDLAIHFKENPDTHGLPAAAIMRLMGEKTQAGRWQAWEKFGREVSEMPVMFSDDGILKDFMPGVYYFSKIVNYSDLEPLMPAHTIVKGVRWIIGKDGDQGKVIFPESFDGIIATELATTETLGHYGARLAESDYNQTVELKSRHVLDDYTYTPDYLQKWVIKSAGGAGMEFHEFAHLDCPLDSIRESGHYILAKWTDDKRTAMQITAFKVPARHTVYTPPLVIHTNNYLRGTWRTMLSDEPVYEAKMLRGNTPFHFSIEQEQVQLRREQTEKTGKTPVSKEKKKRKSGTIFSKYFPK